MAIGPAKAGPICLSRGSWLDSRSKAPHRRAAKHAVTRLTELAPKLRGNLFSSEHVLPGLDRLVTGGREVSLGGVVQIEIPAASREARPFRDEGHRFEIGVRER